MTVRQKQDAVFNQTRRIEIPDSFVKEREVLDGKVIFRGFHEGDWSEDIPDAEMDAAELHVDVTSAFFNTRQTLTTPREALDSNWGGMTITVPSELVGGSYVVRLRASIVLPVETEDGGRIIAITRPVLVRQGDSRDNGDTPGTGVGVSLLPVSPSSDIPDLYKLVIDEADGPRLLANSEIPGTNWRDLVARPEAKYGIISSAVRDVFFYLAMHPNAAGAWVEPWQKLMGPGRSELPLDLDDLPLLEIFEKVDLFARLQAEGCIQRMRVKDKFVEALGNQEPEE